MPLRASGLRGNSGDVLRIQLRRVGGGQFLGDNNAAAWNRVQRFSGLLRQLGNEAVADLANVFDASRQIVVLHRAKTFANRGDLAVNGRFRIDSLAFDAGLCAAQQPRILQHHQVGVEEV
jgi:hypothetical protein